MIYLIEYDRPSGSMVTFRVYEDMERLKAEDDRLKLELQLYGEGIEHEVVLLDAVNEEALRATHLRYFEDLSGILDAYGF